GLHQWSQRRSPGAVRRLQDVRKWKGMGRDRVRRLSPDQGRDSSRSRMIERNDQTSTRGLAVILLSLVYGAITYHLTNVSPSVLDVGEKRSQPASAAGMPQLPQCLGLNLADTLAGDPKVLAHFLQRALAPVFEAESHFDHAFFAWS